MTDKPAASEHSWPSCRDTECVQHAPHWHAMGFVPGPKATALVQDGRAHGQPATSEPRRFRKKPAVIEAYQTSVAVTIPTLEGEMRAEPGDWIITGVKGERYPCKPDIFAATYEEAEPPATRVYLPPGESLGTGHTFIVPAMSESDHQIERVEWNDVSGERFSGDFCVKCNKEASDIEADKPATSEHEHVWIPWGLHIDPRHVMDVCSVEGCDMARFLSLRVPMQIKPATSEPPEEKYHEHRYDRCVCEIEQARARGEREGLEKAAKIAEGHECTHYRNDSCNPFIAAAIRKEIK